MAFQQSIYIIKNNWGILVCLSALIPLECIIPPRMHLPPLECLFKPEGRALAAGGGHEASHSKISKRSHVGEYRRNRWGWLIDNGYWCFAPSIFEFFVLLYIPPGLSIAVVWKNQLDSSRCVAVFLVKSTPHITRIIENKVAFQATSKWAQQIQLQ